MGTLIPFFLAVVFAGAYLQVRLPSRSRPGGGLARLILAGGACLLVLDGLFEMGVQREFKPEKVPIRLDLVFVGPALFALIVLGALAYFYGLGSGETGRTHNDAPACVANLPIPPETPAEGHVTGTPEQVNERLAHLLPSKKDGRKY